MLQNNATPIRVLFVEDEKAVQDAIARMLELLGYQVTCADNGKQGVDLAKSWQPDFILMDIRMPVMDGLEATRRLRSNPATTEIPIFILSAYTDARSRRLYQDVGADGFLAKPTSISKLNFTIQKTLRRKNTGPKTDDL